MSNFSAKDMITKRVAEIPPSGIRKFFDIAAQMDDVISLGVGEPDFVTPSHIRDAGIVSLRKGRTYYTANAGLAELRQEISTYLKRRFDIEYDALSEVLVTVGGSEAIDLMVRSIIGPGDEVLIPEPCFVCYSPCVALAGGTPVPIVTRAEDEFRLTPEQIKEKLTDKTKLLILPFPNNPTGAIMEREHLEAIAEVIRESNIMILSDEIYAELTYGKKHISITQIEGMKERTILVGGFSKAYAMTGWRLGFACGNADIIKVMTKVHQFAIMCTPTTSQYAAIEALKNGDNDIERMRQEYDYRRKFIVDGFRNMGLDCFEPRGAFYVFPSIQKTGLSSDEFAEKLLRSKKVAVVPGSAFGASGEGFIRCSYAYSIENIRTALGRISDFVSEYL